jgi:phosphate transport system substrate-binding protein
MMKLSPIRVAISCVLILCGAPSGAQPRDQIVVVGSSTIYPFSVLVADHFAKSGPFATPSVESSSTTDGFRAFCAGTGAPDITAASRRMASNEKHVCAAMGVRNIVEIQIGYDGLILAGAAGHPGFNITLDQFWRAVAKYVPVNGSFTANPYRNWRDIASTLPDRPIQLWGPAPGQGVRDALVSLVVEPNCISSAAAATLPDDRRNAICTAIRDDGRWTDVEDIELILGKIASHPQTMGILTYSYLEQFPKRIFAATVNGVSPTRTNIASGVYPVSSPLFIYVNGDHLTSTTGLADYAAEFVSLCAAGANGYLLDEGLVPLPIQNLLKQRKMIARLPR